ncbi:MAG: proteasome assembly chaperone family protein, partial [Nitrosarchaeum sp.]
MKEAFPEAEVFEVKKVELNSPIIFAGFVGAGLVGSLAINHIIEELKMEEIGLMRSKYLPPSTVFMKGRLRHPFRFYANKKGTICTIICEITLRMEGLYSLVSAILDWAEKKGSKEIVILDGIPSDEHDDKAYCAANEDLIRTMADKDISMIPQGFITGIPGGILNECIIRKIQG